MRDLTTPDSTLAYLEDTPYAASSVELLTGGRSAFVYRVMLKSPLATGETSIIVKHYEAYGAAFTQKKISIERGNYEYKALVALANSGLFDSNSAIQVPRPFHYDPDTYTIFMADLGPLATIPEVLAQRLQNALSNLSDSQTALRSEFELASKVGLAIGDFLGRFHNWGASPEQAQLRGDFLRNTAPETCLAFHHGCMSQSVARLGPEAKDPRTNEILAVARTDDLLNGDVLAMGDCFLSNVMATPSFGPHNLRLYILDWETARPGPSELDIGVLTGSTLSFARKYYAHEEYPLLPAVHRAYHQHRTLEPRQLAITTGMYTFGISTMMPWCKDQSEEYAQSIAVSGFELLKLAFESDMEGIKENNVLKFLFN